MFNPNPPGDAGTADCHYLPSQARFDEPEFLPDAGQPLVLRHVRRLANGMAFASSQGMPLTALVTIHLCRAERFRSEDWSTFQTDLLDKASRWLKRRGLPVAFAWCRENGPRKGPHLHLLAHLSYSHWGAFHRYLTFAGHFDAGGVEGNRAILITGGNFGMLVETMRAGALRYLCKSLDASADTLTVLGLRSHPTEPVSLKRCGTSTSIGTKARKEAGWIERTSIPALAALLHPANDNVAEGDLHAA